MGPWIPQSIALLSTGGLTVKSLEVSASLDVFTLQQSQSTQSGICPLLSAKSCRGTETSSGGAN